MRKPLGDRVLVKLESKDVSEGGIMLQTALVSSGVVMDLGPEVKKKQSEYDEGDRIMVGDRLWLPKGDRIGDKFEEDGSTFILIPFAHLISKF